MRINWKQVILIVIGLGLLFWMFRYPESFGTALEWFAQKFLGLIEWVKKPVHSI